MVSKLYYSKYRLEKWNFIIVQTNNGVCYIKTAEESKEAWTRFKNKYFAEYQLVAKNEDYLVEHQAFTTYLTNSSLALSIETDRYGTDFQSVVWEQLRSIPYGQTLSYQAVADQLGRPTATRAVANAIGANPLLIETPCHRVIGKNGQLTGFRSGIKLKNNLLELEQKQFTNNNY